MSSSRAEFTEPLTPKSTRVPGSFPTDPISPGQQAQRNLAREVFERRDEYIKTSKFKIKIGSWNVAALPGTTKDLGAWFAKGKGISQTLGGVGTKHDGGTRQEHRHIESVEDQEKRRTPHEPTVPVGDQGHLPKDDDIDVYALGLQEIVDVNSAAQALRPFNDPHPSRLWKAAVSEALPKDYVFIAEQQLLGLLLLIYASPSIAKTISSVSTTYVGTGVMGYMGNKGAVAIRLVLGETAKFVFINSHLAAGSDKASLDRRNWDFGQIMQRVQFDPIDRGYGMVEEVSDAIGDEDFAFWFGDLNYRLGSIPGDDVRRLLLLHTRNEYDINQREETSLKRIDHELRIDKNLPDHDAESTTSTKVPSDAGSYASSLTDYEDRLDPAEDPASLLTTISSLLPHDQLHEQMRLQKAFSEGWREGPIKFLPTYKYDVGSVGMFDSSEKKRAPSWCDRILFRTRKDFVDYQKQRREQHDAEKRDKEMKDRGLENGGDEVIFDYDPETDAGEDDDEEDDAAGNDDAEDDKAKLARHDRIQLDFYTSHQRVLSSDHKPLDAVFSVEYDAVDPKRKAMVHQEVAREIDRAENETRPALSVVFDNNTPAKAEGDGCYFGDLRFREQKSTTMTMANTSPVTATFSFLAKEGFETTPSWLSLVFHHEISKDTTNNKKPTLDLTLEPGESSSVDVIAQVVQPSDVTAFNEGISQPDDILILRIRNGRDHFIPVQAHWLRTCFGTSLDALVRLPAGDGARSQPVPSSLLSNKDKDSDVRWSAPRELFRLTEALEEHLLATTAAHNSSSFPELSRPGWPFVHFTPNDSYPDFEAQYASILLSLRDSLDTNTPFTFPPSLSAIIKTNLLAQTLILFLTCMPGRLIPCDLWTTLSSSLAAHERSKRPPLAGEDLRAHILDILSTSPLRSVSFTFVTFMLQRIIAQLASVDGTDKEKKHETGSSSPLYSPRSPEALLRRARGMSLSVDPRAVRRREIEKIFGEVFLGLIFDEEGPGAGAGPEGKTAPVMVSAKMKKAEMERKKIVLEAFLRGKEEEGN